jgi:hypothetical protein
MNRQQRRADKRTRHLLPLASVLWIPVVRGYLVHLTPENFTVAESADLALQLCGECASVAALNFNKATGLNVVIRPLRNFK